MTVQVRELWERWGTYQTQCRCDQCARVRVCRGPHLGKGPWLCRPCFNTRPVDENRPEGRGKFRGRCYLCGAHCSGVFCHAHQWASR